MMAERRFYMAIAQSIDGEATLPFLTKAIGRKLPFSLKFAKQPLGVVMTLYKL